MTKENFSSPEFIDRLKNNGHQAISQVVHAYTGQLLRAAYGQGLDSVKAEEVVQNTWVTFFEVVKRFEGRSHIRTFLFGIFYNKVSEGWRKDRQFEKMDPIDEVVESRFDQNGHWRRDEMDPRDLSEQKELFEIIEKCTEKLPPNQRMALSLKLVHGEGANQICDILGVTSANLRQLIFRGKNRVRECVEGQYRQGDL